MNMRTFYFVTLVILIVFSNSTCAIVTSMIEKPTPAPTISVATITPTPELATLTRSPTPTATKPMPTLTPTPKPPTATTTPTPIQGIDVPMVITNVSVRNSFGVTETGDIQLQVLDAFTQESLGGGTKQTLPEEEGYVFLTLNLLPNLRGPANAINWIAEHGEMVCGQERYKATHTGLEIVAGILESETLHYQIPAETSFESCSVQLPDGREIPLERFFETAKTPPTPSVKASLVISHEPNPARFVKSASGNMNYICKYGTSVKTLDVGVHIQAFGMLFWEAGKWVHSPSNNGKPWSPEDFSEWYSCPNAYIPAGGECTDPQNWNGSDTNLEVQAKWYYRGLDDNGNTVEGEMTITCLEAEN